MCATFTASSSVAYIPCRRALREEQPPTVLGQPLVELTWQNTCPERGVDFRFHIDYDGFHNFFSKEFTDIVPAPFLDYMCDNSGQVGVPLCCCCCGGGGGGGGGCGCSGPTKPHCSAPFTAPISLTQAP